MAFRYDSHPSTIPARVTPDRPRLATYQPQARFLLGSLQIALDWRPISPKHDSCPGHSRSPPTGDSSTPSTIPTRVDPDRPGLVTRQPQARFLPGSLQIAPDCRFQPIAVTVKKFSVSPVVFPSSAGNPNVTHERQAPPFQRPRPSKPGPANTSIPFISMDILSILNPLRVNPSLHEDADLSGPFLFLMVFGLFQLLARKFHFGIILGWFIVAALYLYVVFNMLAGRNGNLDLYRCSSLVGYCMLPMVMFSAVSLSVPHDGIVIFAMAAVSVLWSTRVCTGLLVELVACRDEHRGLVAYACCLVYMLFSLLIIF
ncbi:uncharacterized protein LOC135671393 [Musa acuminata AAA Group]|uniref:uncharacterized protein LOC135670972 n=1 Tax=Musa acuminata AAA Group TaxID=214697 RepID=UPI0031DFEF5F